MKNLIRKLTIIKDKEQNSRKKKMSENGIMERRINLRIVEIYKRLKILYSNKQFIEYLCFLSQFIEFKIKYLISKIHKLAKLKNKKIKIDKDIEDKSLGFLKNILDYKYVRDIGLIREIKKFNDIRVKSIHKLFNVNIEIIDIENEIKNKAKFSIIFKNILDPLDKYIYAITKEIINIKSKSGQFSKDSKSFIEKISFELEESQPILKDKSAIKNIKI